MMGLILNRLVLIIVLTSLFLVNTLKIKSFYFHIYISNKLIMHFKQYLIRIDFLKNEILINISYFNVCKSSAICRLI